MVCSTHCKVRVRPQVLFDGFVFHMYSKENCETVSRQQLTLQPSEQDPFGNVKGKFSATVGAKRRPDISL